MTKKIERKYRMPVRVHTCLQSRLSWLFPFFLLVAFGSHCLTQLNLDRHRMFKNTLQFFTAFNQRSTNFTWLTQDMSKCSPLKNIAYLKVHKAASSSVQALLFRFGLKNDLNFALPKVGNYFGKEIPFKSNMIPRDFGNKFEINIFAIHTKWDFEQIMSVMPKDTVYMASVREPVSLFESLFSYVNFEQMTGMSLDEYVRDRPINADRIYSYLGYNQMVWDFGLPEEDLFNEQAVRALINEADEKFDLVLVAEKLDQSLILMRHLLCWSYEDVVTFKVNARAENFKSELNEETRQHLEENLSSDMMLYNHMTIKLDQLIREFGEERMAKELKELARVKESVATKCNLTEIPNNRSRSFSRVNRPYSKKVTGYTGNINDESCRTFIYNEINIITYTRAKQKNKLRRKTKN